MVTHESLKEWLAVQGHPLEVVEDPRTGMPIYVLQQRSDVAKMRYLGLLAIPPGRFMMVKVVGCSVEKYHPRACEAVLTQFNGLLNRRKTKDSYNYVIDKGHLAIVFWPENTTTDEMGRVLQFGFDRLDFMFRNLERLDLEGRGTGSRQAGMAPPRFPWQGKFFGAPIDKRGTSLYHN